MDGFYVPPYCGCRVAGLGQSRESHGGCHCTVSSGSLMAGHGDTGCACGPKGGDGGEEERAGFSLGFMFGSCASSSKYQTSRLGLGAAQMGK